MGGSSSQSGPEDNNRFASATSAQNYSANDVDTWLKTSGGQGYKDQADNVKNATYDTVSGKYLLYNGKNPDTELPDQDVTEAAKAFLVWKNAQTSSAASYADYVDATKNAPGRSDNILTGPATNPNTILGGR